MQPTLCSRCKKNVAVVFISRTNEKNETVNEGLCLKCAAQLGLPQVEDMMKRMGISPDDLEGLNNEMMQAFGGAEEMSDLPEGDGEDDEESGKTATFPFLNRLFGSGMPPRKSPRRAAPRAASPREHGKRATRPTRRKVSRQLLHQPLPARPRRQARRRHRPRRGDRARRSDPQPPPEEQPLPHRRAGRRQDGHRRGAGPAHRRGRGALQAAQTRKSTSST